jgi:hypothetical protein
MFGSDGNMSIGAADDGTFVIEGVFGAKSYDKSGIP